MNICLVVPEYPTQEHVAHGAGIGAHYAHLARTLAKTGHVVHVLTLTRGKARDCQEKGVHLHKLNVTPPFFLRIEALLDRLPIAELYAIWKVNLALSKMVKKFEIDIIETTSSRALCLIYLHRKRRLPVATRVNTTHEEAARYRFHKFAKSQKLIFWLERLAIKKSDYLIAPTQAHRDQICKKLNLDLSKFELISHGIEVKNHVSKNALDRERNELNILYVGRLEERKGTDLLLKAIPKVIQECPSARFTLAGKDFRGNRYEKEFFGNGGKPYEDRVTFAGQVDNETLERLYEDCDILVVPSRYESFGLIYAEAMSHGKPVIGCRVGGVPEVVIDGVTGLLARADDVDDLASKIIELAADPEKRCAMGNKGYEHVRQNFTAGKMALLSVGYYEKILRETNPRWLNP